MSRFAAATVLAVSALVLAACGGSPASHSHASPTHSAIAPAMTAAEACKYLGAWQARYGLGGERGLQGLRYVATKAAGNRIGVIAGKMLHDELAHPSHQSVTYDSPYETKLANICIRITGNS